MGRFSFRAIIAAVLMAGGVLLGHGPPAVALPLAAGKQAPAGQAAAINGELVQRTGNVSFHLSVGHRPRHYSRWHHGYRPVYRHYRPVYRHRPVYYGYRPVYRSHGFRAVHYGSRPVYRSHSFRQVHYGYRPVYRPRTVCRVTYRRVWSSFYGQTIMRPVRVCSRRW